MLSTASGPGGTWFSGWEYDLPETVAMQFIEGGFATNLEPAKAKRAPKPEPPSMEVALEPELEERAVVTPKRKPRTRKRG